MGVFSVSQVEFQGSMLSVSRVLLLCFAILIGTIIFSRGLLSKRTVVTNRGQDSERCQQEKAELGLRPSVDQVVLVLIDAMRPDFAIPMLGKDFAGRCDPTTPQKRFTSGGSLTYIEEALLSPHHQAAGLMLVADSPTTTAQRLKAISTGTLPAFIEAGANFNSDAVQEDSLIAQVNGKAVVLGDDTWLNLFDRSMWQEVHVFPSFDVRDLDSNDDGVLQHLNRVLRDSNASLVVVHFLGIDHAGHSFHASHPHIERKLNQFNVVLRNISQQLQSAKDDVRRMILVFGDHGMTESGDHGGPSPVESDTFLFAEYFSSKAKNRAANVLIGEMAEHRFRNCEKLDDLCRLNFCGKKFPSRLQPAGIPAAFQVDLVPTVAQLLQVPIPFSNIGRTIPELHFLAADPSLDESTLRQHLSVQLQCNEDQMRLYFHTIGSAASAVPKTEISERGNVFEDQISLAQMSAVARRERTFINVVGLVIGLVVILFALAIVVFSWSSSVALFNLRAQLMIVTIVFVLFVGEWLGTFSTNLAHGICASLVLLPLAPKWKALRGQFDASLSQWTVEEFIIFLLLLVRCACLFSNSTIVMESYVVLMLLQIALVLAVPYFRYPAVPLSLLVMVRLCHFGGQRARHHGTHFADRTTNVDLIVELESVHVFVQCAHVTLNMFIAACGSNFQMLCPSCLLAIALIMVEGSFWMHFAIPLSLLLLLLGRVRQHNSYFVVGRSLLLLHMSMLPADGFAAQLSIAAQLVFCRIICARCEKHAPLLTALLLHLGSWLFFFAQGQQCIASTIDWKSAFVGLHSYSMGAGATLMLLRSFSAFVVPCLFPNKWSVRALMIVINFAVLASSSISVGLQRHHLMLFAIFCPKFLADVAVSCVVAAACFVAPWDRF